MRMTWGSLTSQLRNDAQNSNFSSWLPAHTYRRMNATTPGTFKYGSRLFCCRSSSAIARVGCADSDIERDAVMGAVARTVLRALLSGPRASHSSLRDHKQQHQRAFCISYTDMRYPDAEASHRLFGSPPGGALFAPDALVANPAVWPVWRWKPESLYAHALVRLLDTLGRLPPLRHSHDELLAGPKRVPSVSLAASREPRLRVVLWTSPPVRSLNATKGNITLGRIARFANISRAVVMAQQQRVTRTFDVRLIDAAGMVAAGVRDGVPGFVLTGDGLHWSAGSNCFDPKKPNPDKLKLNKLACMLYKERDGLPIGLYSCLWDATQNFLSGA